MTTKNNGVDLLPLRRMAARIGVPVRWLREQAESGGVPGLRAGDRWLFVPDVVAVAVMALAGDSLAAALQQFAAAVKTGDAVARDRALEELRKHGIDSAANLIGGAR